MVEFPGRTFWGWIHGMLLLMAGVGISVAFVASIMYLVQMRRLQSESWRRARACV